MRRTLVFLAVALAVVAFAGAWWWFASGVDGSPVGGPVALDKPLPALSGEGLNGAPLDAASYRGKVLVINAWASWCAPCQREQPALAALARRYQDQGVAFMGVNYRDGRASAKRWVNDQFHVPYPSIYDPAGRSAAVLSYPLGLPDTYVVDPSGTIRWAVYGETDAHQLSGIIDQVLASTSGSPTAAVAASPST